MKQVTIGNRNVPAIIQGCMRIGNLDTKSLQNLIEKQLESGVNFWDHADIYGGGTCETIFGEALHQIPGMRDKLILQSKCGIRPGAFTCYDFSKAHIIRSVETSLRRLQTDRLDYLLLHRPDLLMEPEEVAEAFDQLESQGKVLHFGVSNHTPQPDRTAENLRQTTTGNQSAAIFSGAHPSAGCTCLSEHHRLDLY